MRKTAKSGASKKKLEGNATDKCFTVLELLVVVAIVGIVAALLLPTLATGKAQAQSVACKNRLFQMGRALHIYVQENGGKYPYILSLPETTHGSAGDGRWFAKLQPYHLLSWTDPAYHCPGYKGTINVPTNPVAGHDPLGSYAYNWRGVRGFRRGVPGEAELGLGGVFNGAARPGRRQSLPVSEAQVRMPSEMFAIGESRFMKQPGIVNQADCIDSMFCGYLRPAALPARHGKDYNQLFCDGHVAAMRPWTLFNPTNTAPMWNNDHEPHRELWPHR